MKLAEINSSRDTEKSLNYLLKAKKCAIELKENFYIASSDISLGDYYYRRKEYKTALKHYNDAYKLAGEDFSKDNIAKIEMRIQDIKRLYNAE